MTKDERGGGHWLHVARAHIETRAIETIFAPADLRTLCGAEPTWPCQPWVSALIAASDDGTSLTCTVGLPEPRANGAFHMSYSLFELDPATRTLERLADFHETPGW